MPCAEKREPSGVGSVKRESKGLAMKEINMKEFALRCRNEARLRSQLLTMPGTVTLERLFDLAEANGYRIVPERTRVSAPQIRTLDPEELDQVTGGFSTFSPSELQSAWREWFCIWAGIGGQEPAAPVAERSC